MRKISLLLLLAAAISSFGQKPPAKFGDIPMEDMKMTVYPLDSSAAAVVLFDYGVDYYERGLKSNNERHTRIKILKKEGLGQADIVIPLLKFGSFEQTVINLKAVTYNFENAEIKETKLSKEGIFKDKLNKNIIFYKFTMPNVREGSIIEYSYTISSYLFALPHWQFQQRIPVRLSEFWFMEPSVFSFGKNMQGYIALDSYTTDQTNYYNMSVTANHYIVKDVPAFKIEPYMTSESDFISKILFNISYIKAGYNGDIMSSWETLNNRLVASESFGRAINNSDFLKEEVSKTIAGITEADRRIEAISNYVKNSIEWDGTHDYIPDPLKKVFEKKKGSSADINFLLAAMLSQLGFNIDMVLLSTRDHGFIRKNAPMQEQFNYVVCLLNTTERTYLLDATEKYLPFDILPSRCLNGQGLRISKVNHGWVDINSKTKEKTTISSELTLTDAGILNGKIDYTYDGYDALKIRKDYFSKGEEEYTKNIKSNKQWGVENIEFKDTKDVNKPTKISYIINIDEHATKSGDIIYLNPFIENRMTQNPFKSEKREYPVDYGNKEEKTYICRINIPEGFVIDELPQSKVMVLPENAARYTYNMVQLGNTINITSTFQVNKIIFTQLEYPLLREFYNQVVAKQAEQIVLKKK